MKTYCPRCENELINIDNSILWSEYYYCENCDNIFVPKLIVISSTAIENRIKDMKRAAKIRKIKNNLKLDELIELGYKL